MLQLGVWIFGFCPWDEFWGQIVTDFITLNASIGCSKVLVLKGQSVAGLLPSCGQAFHIKTLLLFNRSKVHQPLAECTAMFTTCNVKLCCDNTQNLHRLTVVQIPRHWDITQLIKSRTMGMAGVNPTLSPLIGKLNNLQLNYLWSPCWDRH